MIHDSFRNIAKFYSRFDEFFSEHSMLAYSLGLAAFAYYLFSGFSSANPDYAGIHLDISFVSFAFFLLPILRIRPKVTLLVIIVIVYSAFHYRLEIFLNHISSWFFNSSPFKGLFEKVAAKDDNVFIMTMFCFELFAAIVSLMVDAVFKKRPNPTLVASAICLSAFIGLTAVIHYAVVEKGFISLVYSDAGHMRAVYYVSDKRLFYKVCEIEGYVCSYDGGVESVAHKVDAGNFLTKIRQIGHPTTGKPSFFTIPIEFDKNRSYIVYADADKWVIDQYSFEKFMDSSGKILMFVLDCGHGFWIALFVWIALFHSRTKISKNSISCNQLD